ncbi:hypothetical protein KXW98_003570 [Aspergillus fumigatus]|nr:hypothetical protein KXX45_007898 [Aspergillus fumigatus]KAH1291898.1 hypothetical protein KXX48_006755 [Aspergillus fumigatus]KAH1292290.1 hypothetical protein KXX30_005558 [Aspergillus fumigatus]KAH1318649.1 hypothetical protein KXX66_004563 [Aspergillus fumigatus]KAH1356907.1 hypothetical protein KXX33_006913 [Aspergillus fumigatus]
MAEEKSKIRDDVEATEPIGHVPPQIRDILKGEDTTHDAVFGEVTEAGPNYRNVGWLGTVALMMKTQIGLGVLSIPSVFDTVGMIPGVILLCIVASIAAWTSYVVGVFKINHRQVYGIDDAGGLMFGAIGKEIFATAFCLYWIFVAGSGILGISISLNAISAHGACTAVYVAVAAIIGFFLASIRTLGKISWIAWLGLACILTAILIVTIGVGIQKRPSSVSQVGPWSSDFRLINSPSFTDGVSAVSSLIFACSATPTYFSIAAEMRDPRFFTRALIISQIGSTLIYLVIGVVVYYYCGSHVASPALGSAGPIIKKISYGIALPGLLATTTIVIHLPSKYIFVRILRGSAHLTSNSIIHWCTWLACTFGSTVIAYLIASGIPFFNNLVSLIGAFLGVILAYQPTGCMWFYDNWRKRDTGNWKWILMACWNVFVILIGSFMTVAGTYGAIVNIVNSLAEDGGSKPWTCADNSNS